LPTGYAHSFEIFLLYKTPSIDAKEAFGASTTFIDVRVVSPAKFCSPRLVNPVPMFTVVSAWEPENTSAPRVVTVFGIFIEVINLLPEKE
jgi:hypothetical protein